MNTVVTKQIDLKYCIVTKFSSSNSMMSSAFRQFNPRQSPQAVTHLRPLLRQEHAFVPHGFLEVTTDKL